VPATGTFIVTESPFPCYTGEVGDRLFQSELSSPVGPLRLVSTGQGLAALALGDGASSWLERWLDRNFPGESPEPATGHHLDAATQLREYFAAQRRVFDLPLDLRGTPFQRRVWTEVARIPFGRTASYSMVALLVDRPQAARAVGAANGANPVPIVVPCHRVVGAQGDLTGYGGGLPVKRWLLAHEGVLVPGPVQMGLFRGRPVSPVSSSR
jgi:O-6-methylguanine DNA methyltransferase